MVLVVDDDPAVLVATIDLVESLGYRALRALDGEEALGLLDRTDGIDVLMTDLGLGRGMNGRDLARQAVARRPELKILYASGVTQRPPGDAAAILKPYTMNELERRLQTLLGGGPVPANSEA